MVCTIIEYRFIAMRHIFNSLLLEHKHSKQNDDIQYVSARKPSSAVHTVALEVWLVNAVSWVQIPLEVA